MTTKYQAKKKLRQGSFLTNPIYIQVIYPFLVFLVREREKISAPAERMGINAGIVLHSAIFLEGFLEDFLCTFVPHYMDSTGGKTPALIDIERKTGLDGYKQIFRGFGLHLRDFLSGREQEDLDFIFRYRNLLAHGQRDSYIIYHGKDLMPQDIAGSVYLDIEKFLIKRKVLSKSGSVQTNHNGLFSDVVADWTFRRANDISEAMSKKLQERFPYFQMNQQANLLRLGTLMKVVTKHRLN